MSMTPLGKTFRADNFNLGFGCLLIFRFNKNTPVSSQMVRNSFYLLKYTPKKELEC